MLAADRLNRIRRSFKGNQLLFDASAVHLANDACFSVLYPLLPFIAADLGLSFTEVGLLKASFSGASGLFQVPAASIGARYGEYAVLMIGNTWVGLGLLAMGLAGGFLALLIIASLAGLGGNAQHPLAASLVSRHAEGPRLATAMGTLNFSGDLGKFIAPFVAGIVAVQFGWQAALAVIGLPAAALSLGLLLARGRRRPIEDVEEVAPDERSEPPLRDWRFRFVLLAGGLDTATRGAALTFLPFVLTDKGFDAAEVSALYGVIFAAGAAGKFGCGWISDRRSLTAVIVSTELVTAGVMLAILGADAWLIVPLVIAFGFALNGTSSALTVAVARYAPPERRGGAYGIYFTVALVSSAFAPLAYGVLADATNLNTVFIAMSIMTVTVIPAILPLRSSLEAAR